MKLSHLTRRFRIDKPGRFRLADHDPAECLGLDIEKNAAKEMLALGIKRLSELQERLWASDRWAVLAIFQAMDAAGKDSVIKHVMTGINPQGCEVHSFKAPGAQELDHDFLWRSAACLPERGRIGIFNRSYYEEVLVVRVDPRLLASEKLPPEVVSNNIWKERFADICALEDHLLRNGTIVLKFFLNVSREEQRRRFLQRIDNPAKRWKFSMDDVEKRKRWDDYMRAYEDMIRHTSRPAPWYVVPADKKWFTQLVVAGAMVDALDGLDLQFPKVSGAATKDLEKARRLLEAERPRRGRLAPGRRSD